LTRLAAANPVAIEYVRCSPCVEQVDRFAATN